MRVDLYIHHVGRGPLAAFLTIEGSILMQNISIDSTTGDAKVVFVDDKGDTDAAAPDGAVITYSSSDPAVATIDASTGHITPVAEGNTDISATIADASGNPILEPSGEPFAVTASTITIVAGAAVGAELEIQS